MAANDLNNIISVFVNRNVIQLCESDLESAIRDRDGINSSTDVCRVVRTCPSLFQLRRDIYGTLVVQVEPTIDICQNFLDRKCPFKTQRCNQLHLCRYFGHCSKKDCRFPHNFTHGQNRHIVMQSNCEMVDPTLLVRLIKLYKQLSNRSDEVAADVSPAAEPLAWSSSVQPKPTQLNAVRGRITASRGRSRRGRLNMVPEPTSLTASVVNLSCEIKISCPIPSSAYNITIEGIKAYLGRQGLSLGKTVHSRISKDFYQWTVQVEENSTVDELLTRSDIQYGGISLKFKRARPLIDTRSFVLRSKIDVARGPIRREAVSAYIDHLLDQNAYELSDVSSKLQQSFLVQCENTIDFNRLCRLQNSQRQVRGTDVTLARILELDTIMVESTLPVLSPDNLESIFESVSEDVFTFDIVNTKQARVEFIKPGALDYWLRASDGIQQKFDMNIMPVVQYVDDDNERALWPPAQPIEPEVNDTTYAPTTINLRTSWAMIANHPVFSKEYKDYIRSELGVEIQIHGDRIEVCRGTSSNTLASETTSTHLNDRTSSFMKRFAIRSIVLQERETQLDILQTHSSMVAFHHSKGDNYVIATKQSNMGLLMAKLSPRRSTDCRPSIPSPVYNRIESVADKQSTPVVAPQPMALIKLHATSAAVPQSVPVITPRASPVIPLQSTSTIPSQLPGNTISSMHRLVVEPETVTKYKILSTDTPAQQVLFGDIAFENRLRTYFSEAYDVIFHIDRAIGSSKTPVAKLIGRPSSVAAAVSKLSSLLPLFHTKTFNSITDGNWVRIPEAVHVIEYQCNRRNIACVCQHQASPLALHVHFIDAKHDKLGVREEVIETLCRNSLVSATCAPIRYDSEWTTVKMSIIQGDQYRKGVCVLDEQHRITLYGESYLVKHMQQRFQLLNQKHVQKAEVPPLIESTCNKSEQPAAVKRNEFQTKSVLQSNEPPVSKETTLMNSKPAHTHHTVFIVDVPGFELLVSQNWNQLASAIESKCSVTKEVIHSRMQIGMPKAQVDQFDESIDEAQLQEDSSTNSKSSWWSRIFGQKKSNTEATQQTDVTASVQPTANTPDEHCIIASNSKITVAVGDLTKQVVDVIVVCSTSRVLCDAVVSAAGRDVQNVHRQQSARNELSFETLGGVLPCKQIAFRPWIHDRSQRQELKDSINKFITSGILYALQKNFTTIAFPSIGCGQLGHDPKLIAEHMIGESYQLLHGSIHSPLTVSFVLLPEQKTVHDAFVDQIRTMRLRNDVPASISFDKQTVKFTLTGASMTDLGECQARINQLAVSRSSKVHLTARGDAAEWPQDAIHKYYDYCLQRRVIPSLDIQNATLDLSGSKDAVAEADKYFFQLAAETLRNARIKVVGRGVVWSVEVQSGKWEQYSYQINERIEDAHAKKLPYVEFKNEKNQRCRIDFAKMQEQCQTRARKVRCKRIDSSLPNNWDLSGGSSKRVILANSSQEYRDMLAKFEATMRGSYQKINTIERIQNERWYKQYHAHREEFTQRYEQPDERLLFHGCSKAAADKIVHECFNRAFAGVNGVVYGCGVYFHEHAQYSSSFTRQEATGERTMFLARVLVGKTCTGTSTMKVPPPGFDTTTDGKHIFVVYHDAGAYAEYLITYT